ncbi:MAG: DUF503 domain-containing protein [Thermomicrobiales bacterium]|nr:DUF503 domain-containing protein [Thermomicrobiales bacterium]MCO5221949.1 DUF503 domain-containing protein [Thermomicrobiales bacterium]
MASVVGVAHITIYLDDSFSLKDKRQVVRSISAKVRNTFNAGIAEVEDLNDMRVATLGVVCISNQAAHVTEMLATIVQFIERNLELGAVGEIETELIHV